MAVEVERSAPEVHAAFRKLVGGMEKGTFRHTMAHYIESPAVEILVLVLVICDVVLVSIEASIDHHVVCVNGYQIRGIPRSEVLEPYHGVAEEAHLLQVGPPSWNDPAELAGQLRGRSSHAHHMRPALSLLEYSEQRAHEEDHGHGHDHGHGDGGEAEEGTIEGHPLGPPGALVCEDRYGHEAHHIVHHCHIWSIAILCIFVVELSIKLAANPPEFCGNPFHVLDFVIVVLSLVVDTFVMWYIHEHAEQMRDKTADVETIMVLLICCRIWRVVRIVHGIFEITHSHHEHTEELKRHVEELEEKNKDLERQITGLGGNKK
eukprot:gnl/TRDRNA2_/TRDRNA2_181759_c0_seq1.p1 gnl/TRDRNA2_/TRDRNA2_181759_c0~~gnl/TRDRNA2_/TRDRNA2_181759_c0_seq1.p1  ORF type:complete len:319 (-),score=56.94 gnl/TRDRNA2_/TRDRNA2_181759_c0_seq1:267-1223(-)